MSPRRLCNIVYAHLVADADPDARKKFDRDLYAPSEGWAVVERRIAERFRD